MLSGNVASPSSGAADLPLLGDRRGRHSIRHRRVILYSWVNDLLPCHGGGGSARLGNAWPEAPASGGRGPRPHVAGSVHSGGLCINGIRVLIVLRLVVANLAEKQSLDDPLLRPNLLLVRDSHGSRCTITNMAARVASHELP